MLRLQTSTFTLPSRKCVHFPAQEGWRETVGRVKSYPPTNRKPKKLARPYQDHSSSVSCVVTSVRVEH